MGLNACTEATAQMASRGLLGNIYKELPEFIRKGRQSSLKWARDAHVHFTKEEHSEGENMELGNHLESAGQVTKEAPPSTMW